MERLLPEHPSPDSDHPSAVEGPTAISTNCEIKEDEDDDKGGDDLQRLEDSLAELICHGDVYIEDENEYDNTETLILRRNTLSQVTRYNIIKPFDGSKKLNGVGDWRTEEEKRDPTLAVVMPSDARTHYRIVLQQPPKSLAEVTDVVQMFEVLGRACKGTWASYPTGVC